VLTDFLYSHPTWEVGLLVIGLWTGLSLLGLYIFHRLVDVNIRHKDTETVGLTYAIVAVVYAVLIAFIVVDVFEAFAKGDTIATAEANNLSSLMLDSAGLPAPLAEAVRSDIDKYIDAVTKSEWPSQQAGKLNDAVFERGWTALAHMSTELAGFEPASMGQNVMKGEMLSGVNQLMKSRRSRIIAAGEHLPDVVWQILILAGAVAVGYSFLFGAHTFRIHLAITGLISATKALVFVLIITLDYPFRGDVSVGDEAFLTARTTAAGAMAEAIHH
jgi:protein-S-isoprenylcysteine O-methyltransferase Ste14